MKWSTVDCLFSAASRIGGHHSLPEHPKSDVIAPLQLLTKYLSIRQSQYEEKLIQINWLKTRKDLQKPNINGAFLSDIHNKLILIFLYDPKGKHVNLPWPCGGSSVANPIQNSLDVFHILFQREENDASFPYQHLSHIPAIVLETYPPIQSAYLILPQAFLLNIFLNRSPGEICASEFFQPSDNTWQTHEIHQTILQIAGNAYAEIMIQAIFSHFIPLNKVSFNFYWVWVCFLSVKECYRRNLFEIWIFLHFIFLLFEIRLTKKTDLMELAIESFSKNPHLVKSTAFCESLLLWAVPMISESHINLYEIFISRYLLFTLNNLALSNIGNFISIPTFLRLTGPKTKATCTHCLIRYQEAAFYQSSQCVHIAFTWGLLFYFGIYGFKIIQMYHLDFTFMYSVTRRNGVLCNHWPPLDDLTEGLCDLFWFWLVSGLRLKTFIGYGVVFHVCYNAKSTLHSYCDSIVTHTTHLLQEEEYYKRRKVIMDTVDKV
ncbi:hypothetical protein VP01_1122g1 [Puccinia sorghi]|uniref:Uncharacterized protein n=1 Tax=Puccinia sorghi TaxID=27349 RepID=A0A0L6VSJ9_9BASI|nr:hypothetical protein VP01_1122g1 [Puccinia sorghi]